MANNFALLQAKMPPASRARAEAKAQAMIREMALDERSPRRWGSVPSEVMQHIYA